MGGGGDIEDSEFVAGGFEDVHHGCAEDAGMDRHGLARLQPDLEVVFLTGLLHQPDEEFAVVEGFCDPVTAAHVEVGELRIVEQVSEFPVHCLERAFQVRRILFAEGVEMEAGKPCQIRTLQLVRSDPKAGSGNAGIVDRCLAGGVFRIDAEAALQFPGDEARVGEDGFAEAEPLGQRIEIEVVGEFQQCSDIGLIVGR